jgi:hypothetical protein
LSWLIRSKILTRSFIMIDKRFWKMIIVCSKILLETILIIKALMINRILLVTFG